MTTAVGRGGSTTSTKVQLTRASVKRRIASFRGAESPVEGESNEQKLLERCGVGVSAHARAGLGTGARLGGTAFCGGRGGETRRDSAGAVSRPVPRLGAGAGSGGGGGEAAARGPGRGRL